MCACAVAQAINITKRHDSWIVEYNEKATALKTWMDETKTTYDGAETGNTAAALKEAVDNFNYYLSGVKPEWKQKRLELEGLFNTFAASCRNNDRPVYQPEEGLTMDDLRAQWVVSAASTQSRVTVARGMVRHYLTARSACLAGVGRDGGRV